MRWYVVNREGERVERHVLGGLAAEYVVVDRADIVHSEPMVMNLHYARLEVSDAR